MAKPKQSEMSLDTPSRYFTMDGYDMDRNQLQKWVSEENARQKEFKEERDKDKVEKKPRDLRQQSLDLDIPDSKNKVEKKLIDPRIGRGGMGGAGGPSPVKGMTSNPNFEMKKGGKVSKCPYDGVAERGKTRAKFK